MTVIPINHSTQMCFYMEHTRDQGRTGSRLSSPQCTSSQSRLCNYSTDWRLYSTAVRLSIWKVNRSVFAKPLTSSWSHLPSWKRKGHGSLRGFNDLLKKKKKRSVENPEPNHLTLCALLLNLWSFKIMKGTESIAAGFMWTIMLLFKQRQMFSGFRLITETF